MRDRVSAWLTAKFRRKDFKIKFIGTLERTAAYGIIDLPLTDRLYRYKKEEQHGSGSSANKKRLLLHGAEFEIRRWQSQVQMDFNRDTGKCLHQLVVVGDGVLCDGRQAMLANDGFHLFGGHLTEHGLPAAGTVHGECFAGDGV